MSGHVASMNARSCETKSVVVPDIPLSVSSNHSTPSTLRWFVGSSSTNRSGASISAAARATRLRCPPLSCPIFRPRNDAHPSFSSAVRARDSASHAFIASMRSKTSASRAETDGTDPRRASLAASGSCSVACAAMTSS